MTKYDYKRLSNAEIHAKLVVLENEYAATQNKIKELTEKLMSINESYIQGKKEMNKRTKGMLYE